MTAQGKESAEPDSDAWQGENQSTLVASLAFVYGDLTTGELREKLASVQCLIVGVLVDQWLLLLFVCPPISVPSVSPSCSLVAAL